MSDEMYFVLTDITPELAAKLLEGNTHNRNMRPGHARLIGRDMLDQVWILTHEAIAIAPDGTLLDGQHRLTAIVESGVTVHMAIAYNVDPRAQRVVDRGARRTLADTLKLEYDASNTHVLAAGLRLLTAYVHDEAEGSLQWITSSAKRYSEQECLLVFETHRSLEQSPAYAGLIDTLLQPSMGTFLHYILAQKHHEKADEFFERLHHETLPTTDTHPIRVLRRWLQAARDAENSLSGPRLLYGFIRGWNAFLVGRDRLSIQTLTWRGFGTANEAPFPLIS